MTLSCLSLLILVVSVRYFLFLQSCDLLRMELLVPMVGDMTRLFTFWELAELFSFAAFTSVKCKLQVMLLLMEQDLMFLFCGAFSPVIFVLVSVQMKYFPMNICCCHFLPSKQNESVLVMCALLVHNQCIDCLLGGCLV